MIYHSRKNLALLGILSLFVFTAKYLLAQEYDFTPYSNSDYGFALEVPSDWSLREASLNRSFVAEFAPEEKSSKLSKIVVAATALSADKDLENLAKKHLNVIEKSATLIQTQSGKLAGTPAHRLVFESYNKTENSTSRGELFALRSARNQLFLYFISPKEQFYSRRTKFYRVRDSFHLQTKAQSETQRYAAAAVLGPTLVKQFAGPFYSPRYENGSTPGKEVASAHAKIVESLSEISNRLAEEQNQALKYVSALADIYNKLDLILLKELEESQNKLSPDAGKWWEKNLNLKKQYLEFSLLNAGKQGALNELLKAQKQGPEASNSIEGAELLLHLISATSEMQVYLLQQNEEVLLPLLLVHAGMEHKNSIFPNIFKLRFAQKTSIEREVVGRLQLSLQKTNDLAKRQLYLFFLLKEFDKRVVTAYLSEIKNELPKLKKLRQEKEGSLAPEVDDLLRASISNIENTYSELKDFTNSEDKLNWSRIIGDFLVPPAYARMGLWDFTKKFAQNAKEALYVGGHLVFVDGPRAVGKTVRGVSGAVGYGVTRATQELSNSIYSPLYVGYRSDELTNRAEVKKIYEDSRREGYLELRQKTIGLAEKEWTEGRFGVSAVQQAVKEIDNVNKRYFQGAAKAVFGDGWLGKGAGFLASVGYGVVMDNSKNILVLSDPDASNSDKAIALVGIAAGTGASSLALRGTAGSVGKAAAKKGGQAVVKANSLLTRLFRGAKAADLDDKAVSELAHVGRAFLNGTKSKIDDALKTLNTAKDNVLNAMADSTRKKAETCIKAFKAMLGVSDDAARAAADEGIGQIAKRELFDMATDVMSKFAQAEGGNVAVVKKFFESFALKNLLIGGADNLLQEHAMKPVAQMMLDKKKAAKKKAREVARKAAEVQRTAESARKAAEAKRVAEAARKATAARAARIAVEKARKRSQAQARKAAEAKRATEAKRKAAERKRKKKKSSSAKTGGCAPGWYAYPAGCHWGEWGPGHCRCSRVPPE